MSLIAGSDGNQRCEWGVGDDLYEEYHDTEWGRPVVDDDQLFEKIVLEGFQAGLAWITILRKRERFREVFHRFEIPRVAGMGPDEVDRLLGDAGIVRHRGKIESAISNASAALELIAAEGSLASFVWSFIPNDQPAPLSFADMAASTPESTALSRELKRRGFRFVGPTTVYAFMQAMGLVNDHLAGCWVREDCEAERQPVVARISA